MKTILQNVAAVVLGLIVGSIANMAILTLGSHTIPLPAGVDAGDAKSLADNAHLLSARHYLFPFLDHAGGTLAGAIVAHVIAAMRRRMFGLLIGILFLAGGVAACFMIPAPAWFVALDLALAYIPFAWLGCAIAGRLRQNKAAP